MSESKIICFDLDDTLCFRTSEEGRIGKYRTCYPNPKMVNICNECYDKGYEVIIFTARGMAQFNGRVDEIYDNLYELTKKQLNDWGVKHHKLVMGKQHFHLCVDDKAVNSRDIKNFEDVETFLRKYE